MLGIESVPNESSFLRTSLAARPIASENARTVQGTWIEALVLRGAAVDSPDPLRGRLARRRRDGPLADRDRHQRLAGRVAQRPLPAAQPRLEARARQQLPQPVAAQHQRQLHRVDTGVHAFGHLQAPQHLAHVDAGRGELQHHLGNLAAQVDRREAAERRARDGRAEGCIRQPPFAHAALEADVGDLGLDQPVVDEAGVALGAAHGDQSAF
jgi:hypothetical protein